MLHFTVGMIASSLSKSATAPVAVSASRLRELVQQCDTTEQFLEELSCVPAVPKTCSKAWMKDHLPPTFFKLFELKKSKRILWASVEDAKKMAVELLAASPDLTPDTLDSLKFKVFGIFENKSKKSFFRRKDISFRPWQPADPIDVFDIRIHGEGDGADFAHPLSNSLRDVWVTENRPQLSTSEADRSIGELNSSIDEANNIVDEFFADTSPKGIVASIQAASDSAFLGCPAALLRVLQLEAASWKKRTRQALGIEQSKKRKIATISAGFLIEYGPSILKKVKTEEEEACTTNTRTTTGST